jgi:IS1 family transposase
MRTAENLLSEVSIEMTSGVHKYHSVLDNNHVIVSYYSVDALNKARKSNIERVQASANVPSYENKIKKAQ